MKLTISAVQLHQMVKAVFPRVPQKKALVTVTLVDGSLILQTKDAGTVLGVISTANGEVIVSAKAFCGVVGTFQGTDFIEIEGSSDGLKFNAFKMPVLAWNPAPTMPKEFR